MPRLFTALKVPASISMQLSLLRGGLPGARWIDAENYHLTLRFFGDVDRHTAHEISHELGRTKQRAFDIRIQRLDIFGNAKPHSLFAAVAPSRELNELQAEHERVAKRLGLRPDKRKFTPHVTIARLKGTPDYMIADYLAARGGFSSLPYEVDGFELLSSRDSIGGGPYITEARYELLEALEDDEDDIRPAGQGARGFGVLRAPAWYRPEG
ncbi:MAG: RNA 2',3'-cyclic phosphodiesterase [Nitratireductor sp.]|nr:RNA 2',3'-cyclic phosphodiesterase [Nitratireductor sp.]MCC0022448.1 RNA 2',3'-cyclic phosphodiesterase [Nitratireductor sp.]